MRALLRLFVVAVVLFPLTANATIINIPGDYPTIQEGIDHGSDGDTVLVQPDTYYENLNFYGHNVVLASLFLTSGDTAYVCSTVIDGGMAGSVIILESGEDRGAQVVGFTIQNGYAECGGGIRCSGTSPAISNNNIRGNWVSGEYAGGGGIACYHGSPLIYSNRITRDSVYAYDGWGCGAGIDCYGSGAEITNNTISGNFIRSFCGTNYGGGICCFCSNPTISSNIIADNFSFNAGWGGDGGGLYCYQSNPTISNNIFSHNLGDHGGGIAFVSSASNMRSNAFTGNWGYYDGGAIYCADSYLTITNSILWQDSAWWTDTEIYVESGAVTVTYCDVQGGWPGTGNIDAEPIFAGPYSDDFHLRWHSPCINAGDPNLTDPDGTRSDIGAFYFNLAVLGIVEVYPHDEPIVIPPQGGDISYDGGVLNLSRGNLTVDIWAQAFVPGLSHHHRLWRYNDVTIPFADSIIRANLMERVPSYAPSGDYTFVTYIGDFPSSIIDSSCMYFTKEGAAYTSGEGNGWEALKRWFDGRSELSEATLPTAYSLSQNYPNPFNATTAINYQLPVDAEVTLEIYNLFGQKVATLVDSKQQAGYRSVLWDASSVSSGLYFYRLTAGDFTETRRMMLVK